MKSPVNIWPQGINNPFYEIFYGQIENAVKKVSHFFFFFYKRFPKIVY